MATNDASLLRQFARQPAATMLSIPLYFVRLKMRHIASLSESNVWLVLGVGVKGVGGGGLLFAPLANGR